MDPSASLCLVSDSFTPTNPPLPSLPWYTGATVNPFTLDLKHSPTTSPVPIVFGDAKKYAILQKVKGLYANVNFPAAREKTNPFEHISRSIFINRAGVKLANIDAVHHMTSNIFTLDNMKSSDEFTFCDVAAGPGAFTQYLQYRYPNGIGYGMTLKVPNLDWSTNFIDMKRFTAFYGSDGTGNLYYNWKEFVTFVTFKHPNGVDLVTADGGFDVDDVTDQTAIQRQEWLSSRLLITQILVGLGCTKIDGNFIVKVFDTLTEISAQLLFVLSQCFKDIIIFKPVSSRPANAERYVLCKHRVDDIQPWFALLSTTAESYSDASFVSGLFKESIPTDFSKWLTDMNIMNMDAQLKTGKLILDSMKGTPVTVPEYNIHKFLTIWNLPDGPIPYKTSKIKL